MDVIINKDVFLFGTGYQQTAMLDKAMLDNALLKQAGFPISKMRIIQEVIMKGVQGNEIPIITANLQLLRIGNAY